MDKLKNYLPFIIFTLTGLLISFSMAFLNFDFLFYIFIGWLIIGSLVAGRYNKRGGIRSYCLSYLFSISPIIVQAIVILNTEIVKEKVFGAYIGLIFLFILAFFGAAAFLIGIFIQDKRNEIS